MNQEKRISAAGQVLYNDKWVDKKHFRAFVYNTKEQKLANTYEEFERMISSGIWFVSQLEAEIAVAKVAEEAKRQEEAARKAAKAPITNQVPIPTKLVVEEKPKEKVKPSSNVKQRD